MTTIMDMIRAQEAGPVRHAGEGWTTPCLLCELTRWPDSDYGGWAVVGERVVRGQCFKRDMWRYALVGADGTTILHAFDISAEFLQDDASHIEIMRKLVTS